MPRFQHWFYHSVVPHLDDPATRRAMVWMLAAVFVVLAGEPLFTRAQNAVLEPKLALAPTWSGNYAQNPIALKATVEGDGLFGLSFQIYNANDVAHPLMDVPAAPSPAEPSAWLFTGFNGEPGVSYVIKARGTWGPKAANVEPKNTLSFTIVPRPQ